MKKMMAVLLVAAMMAMLVAGCGSKGSGSGDSDSNGESTSSSTSSGDADGIEAAKARLQEKFDAIEPLDKEVELRYGLGVGIMHDFPAYLVDKAGGLKKANVKSDVKYFANGPLIIEAITSGSLDAGGSGIGGVIAGAVLGQVDIVQLRMEEAIVTKYFVRADSDIAKAGLDESTGFYGSKEQWKGKQVYLPQGTTLQYLFGEALKQMGMTIDDVEPVYMDPQNINTAIYAGQGDAWGLWNIYGYSKNLDGEFIEAFNGETAGISLLTASYVRKGALDDPDLKAAIGKWIECQYAVIEWMQESEENMKAAAEYYYEWCQEEGVSIEKDDVYNYMENAKFYTKEECYDLMTTKGESGNLVGEEMLLKPMDFFISQGNYTEADKDKLIGHFNTEFVEALLK